MARSFRDLIDALDEAGELTRVDRPVDIRYIGTLVEESQKALLFENVAGYDMPVAAGLISSPQRMAIAMDCDYDQIYLELEKGINNRLPHITEDSAPSRQVEYQTGDDVDLYSLPIPVFAALDGGPMITAGVIIAKDSESGLNAGVYRLLVREKNLTSIDIVTPNDLRRITEQNTLEGKSTPISISIGTSPSVILGATYQAPADADELEIAGGILGEPVRLSLCETIDVPCVADAEIVLEGEILPTGWTKPEGRFGEFHRSMGALHWNPQVRINAIYTRKNPIYWALHMPWEVIWLGRPTLEGKFRRKLHDANLRVTAVNLTPAGSCFFHAVIAIKAGVGDGKLALLVALSDHFKHVVVVDEDIDVNDPVAVEWAIATRVQADKDVFIISGVQAKPLDPSLELVTGKMPTTAKMGIDATISRDIPRERFTPVQYAFDDEVNVDDYLADNNGVVDQPGEMDVDALSKNIIDDLESGEPMYYSQIIKKHWSAGTRAVHYALAQLHVQDLLWQDELGRVCHKNSPLAAVPPTAKITNHA